ncbi:hypothetical protein C3420_09795 [Acinetobacter sp. ACNIH3]|uniref:hypothetical protein n=1 Tax=unclassified Acinetobacter TaxID=196816 RepID=UPI000CDE2311|nr:MULTISPECIES: hypothetical protein [unclassified Acinetobacter]POU23697.1 hypothetical protein C3420_09795 [Acinetobacter sp. ACNIH3]POV78403.1 hypothetical protein C3421_07935 [Acinetobacter sp. ACNIH4]
MQLIELSLAVKLAILFSGIFLWGGMLTGVWKYLQIRNSAQSRAHYYVDIAHRSSLLYAPAALILAVLAYYSQFSETINLICIVLNLAFFSFSIGAYILHGMLKDTTNQFKKPHQLGKVQLPGILMTLAMIGLIVAELGGTGILLWGAAHGLF